MKKKLTFIVIIILSCLKVNAQSEDETLVSLTKVNYEGITEFTQWTSTGAKVEVVDDGIAINNPEMQDQSCEPQVEIVPDGSFDLKEGHDYIVRLTVKVPSDGTYMMNIGNWGSNYSCPVPVKASDDYQIIDVEYPEYQNKVMGGHVLLGCGWVTGTTIVKEVEVFERLGYWTRYGFVELTPDESFTYKYVQAMDAKSQETISGLYANMKEKGDKSILKHDNVSGWFVSKDYPLPEGNFYESDFYNRSSAEHANEVYVVLPQVRSIMNYKGRIEDLLEYLGDRVKVDFIKEQEFGDVKITDFRFISNLKTSEEWLKLCMDVSNYGFAGLPNFYPTLTWLNRTYDSHLISMLTRSNEDENLIYSMNWEGVEYPVACMDPDDPWKTADEGLAIVNPEMQEYAGQIWTIISTGGFSLEKNHDYIIRLTLKVPSDGTYVINMGSGSTNCSKEVSVSASDDFQIVDVPFLDFCGDVEDRVFEPIEENAHIFFYSGWVVGTTVVKKVEIYEVNNNKAKETSIKDVKAVNIKKADGAIYNLAGQKVNASYKGIVIKNGKRYLVK